MPIKESAFSKVTLRSLRKLLLTIGLASLIFVLTFGYEQLRSTKATKNEETLSKRQDASNDQVNARVGASSGSLLTSWNAVDETLMLDGSFPVAQEPNSNERAVSLSFDTLSAGVPPYFSGATAINNLYTDIKFSSPAGSVFVFPGSYFENAPSSKPNVISPAVPSAPLTMNFPQPVNNLVLSIVGEDDYDTIGGFNYCQKINGATTCSQPQSVSGIGGMGNYYPLVFDFGRAGINNITQVTFAPATTESNGTLDGLAYDDISFTVPITQPSPTPTPSPSPTPPKAPTDLNGTPEEEEIDLSWTPSQGATSYVIERTDTPPATGGASAPSTSFAPINTISCFTSPCHYPDPGLDSDFTYTYVVEAVDSAGSSAHSNEVKTRPLPKGACQANPTATPPPFLRAGFVLQHGWGMNYFYSDSDGLVLNNIFLNGRPMARQFSVPYFFVSTSKVNVRDLAPTRGELTFNGSANGIRARLLNYKIVTNDPNKLLLEADYGVDHIPGTPGACLTISQKYEFYRPGYQGSSPELNGPCEPSTTLKSCAKFRPMTEYSFRGGNGESLNRVNIPIRLHYQILDGSGNTVSLLRDLDTIPEMLLNLSGFRQPEDNPLFFEWKGPVIVSSSVNPTKDANTMDNFHQTSNKVAVSEPHPVVDVLPDNKPWLYVGPGCPECVHLHWRWSRLFNPANGYSPVFGAGAPIVPPGDQKVDLAVVRYKNGEEHPDDYLKLYTAGEPIRDPHVDRVICCGGSFAYFPTPKPFDVVFWYSPTGSRPRDTFFWHTSWFKAQDIGASAASYAVASTNGSSAQPETPDGPTSVQFGSVYETGATTFAPFDLSALPPLPPGYSALSNLGYKITTTAEVSGPYQVNFSAQSIGDQDDFTNLRIFHAEPDSFDPDKPVWVDATILSPNTPAPDFAARTLSAHSGELGVFVIGRLIQAVPPDSAIADVGVSCVDSADPVTASNDLTYTFTVSNSGPQAATEVAFMNPLSPDVALTSVTPSQGTCKQADGVVYCGLNSLPVGATATVTVVVKPTEGSTSFPAEGKVITSAGIVKAKQTDNNQDNNSVTEDTNVLPNPNKAPVISITSPIAGALLVGPTNIGISATATDVDGTIGEVEFFDNGELIGTGSPAGNNQYFITKQNASFGSHSLIAVATDNGGRQNISNAVNVIVNGAASVSITSPSPGAVFAPDSNITVSANASHPSGIISNVEFFANGQSLGYGRLTGGSQYNIAWNNISDGIYSIVAVAIDGSGITTTSAPITITVDTSPTVTMSAPANGTVFPSATNISLSAIAQSTYGPIARVDFYANGVLIASADDVGTEKFTVTWRHLPDGIYALTAVATDNLGVSATSPAITIGVNTPSPQPGELIWFDDALPAGAVKHTESEDWYWVDANPGAFSGTKAHQSRNLTQAAQADAVHQHYFDGATAILPVTTGDKLFTYAFLDVNNMPRELMLQWKDASGWEHRAYWGANNIAWGADGTSSRKYMGALPLGGTWVRLEVAASDVGLEGSTLNGMAFTLDGGRVTFDLAGKATANAELPPTTQPGDFVWFDESLPTGAVTAAVNDNWNWVNHLHYTGLTSHMSTFDPSSGIQFRSHSFTGAQTPMQVNPGDVLFTYVYLGDPDTRHDPYTPNQIMLQWYDGTSWEHRAFWGLNYIGQRIPNTGVQGTDGQRYMGGMPAARGWYRLEVPASYVGLEGKSVSGMAFTAYRDQTSPYVAWDRSGKSAALTTLPLTLSSTSGVWRSYSSTYGYAFEMPDVAPTEHQLQKISFYVHPNQAAGTVPMHRFRKNGYDYFYTQCRTCPGTEWQYEGVAFYVYPDGSTPGTVPLYLYRDNHSKYFLTIDQNEAASLGMTLDTPTPWAYVWPNANLLPVRPTGLTINGCNLSWTDNSNNETGFKIEQRSAKTSSWKYPKWVEIGAVAANVTLFSVTCTGSGYYRVRAYNATGNSGYSNSVWSGIPLKDYEPAPPNTSPEVSITTPAVGDVLDRNFAIFANAFDVDGNGTIARVEFFANGIKLAEVPDAPYVFVWNNAPAGTYSLTAKATDNAGLTTTSAAVTVTVTDVSTTRINFALAANGAVATAQNYTQDGVYSGYHFYPSYAIDGQRYGHLMPCGCDINGFWRDEHGLASWFQVDFNGSKTIDEVDVFTSADGAAMLTQADPSATQTFTQYGVTAFDVQYWTGSAWQTVPGGSVSGNSLVWKRINFAAVTTSKIRVVVNGAVDNVTRIMEVEAWGSPTTRSNVALASNGATATAQNYTADSTYPGYHWQPSYTIDGQRYCHLLPSGQDGTQFWRDEHGLPSWLEVDFNGSKTIGEIDVYTTKDYPALLAQSDPAATDTFTQFGASAFDVQYWNGGAWQTVSGGSITGNNLVWRKINFAAVITSKIRVVVNSAVDGVARINEVEAWTP